MQNLPPFHLAIRVRDLQSARGFYGELLGCPEGRSADTWVDFNFFGHQLVCHVQDIGELSARADSNVVDDHDVPVPHFGAVLELKAFEQLSQRLQAAGSSSNHSRILQGNSSGDSDENFRIFEKSRS